MKSYEVIGLMSGTSLDGLDIACARFENNGGWHFRLLSCSSLNYNHAWRSKLGSAISLNGLDLKKLDQEYGSFLGRETRAFIDKTRFKPRSYCVAWAYCISSTRNRSYHADWRWL